MRQAGDRRRRIIDVHITASLNRVTDVSKTPGNMLFGPLSTLDSFWRSFSRISGSASSREGPNVRLKTRTRKMSAAAFAQRPV